MSSAKSRSLGVIFLTIFIDLAGFSIIFPLFPEMLKFYLAHEGDGSLIGQLNAWLTSITPENTDQRFLVAVLFGGILGSLYSLLQFVSSPLWGRWSDRFGRRRILQWTVAGTAFSYLLWILSGSFALLIASRLIGGFMAGNIAVATAAVGDVTSGQNRAKGMALVGIAFGLGFIIGPAIGGYGFVLQSQLLDSHPALADWVVHPFMLPAVAALILSLINLVWVTFAFPETLKPENRTADSTAKRTWLGFFSIRNSAVRHAVRVYFVFIFAFAGMEFTLTFLALERLFYSPMDMVKIFLFIGMVLALTQGFIVRRFARKLGEINLAITGLLCGILGLFLLSAAYQTNVFYWGLTFMGLGIGLCSPTLTALVSLYSNEKEQGTHLGAFRSAGALARALGPISAAFFFWWIGSGLTYLIGAGLLIIAVAGAIFLPKPFVPEPVKGS